MRLTATTTKGITAGFEVYFENDIPVEKTRNQAKAAGIEAIGYDADGRAHALIVNDDMRAAYKAALEEDLRKMAAFDKKFELRDKMNKEAKDFEKLMAYGDK